MNKHKLGIATLNPTEIAYGVIDGAVNAFPQGSFIDNCRTNTKISIYNYNQFFVQENFQPPVDKYKVATLSQKLLQAPYQLISNCYFATTTSFDSPPPPKPDSNQPNLVISNSQLLTNLAFNVGYIYTDIVNILTHVYNQGDLFTTTVNSQRLGLAVGDLIVRPFHRDDFNLTFQFDTLPEPCKVGECVVT